MHSFDSSPLVVVWGDPRRRKWSGMGSVFPEARFGVSVARHGTMVADRTGFIYFDPRLACPDLQELVNQVQMGDGAAAIVRGPNEGKPGARLSHNFAFRLVLIARLALPLLLESAPHSKVVRVGGPRTGDSHRQRCQGDPPFGC